MNRRKDTAEYDVEFDSEDFKHLVLQDRIDRNDPKDKINTLENAFEQDAKHFGTDEGTVFPAFSLVVYLLSVNNKGERVRIPVHWNDLTYAIKKTQIGPKAQTLINRELAAEGSGLKIIVKVNNQQVFYTLDNTTYTGEDSDDLLNI